jgi:D-alanine-D-alanine ligase
MKIVVVSNSNHSAVINRFGQPCPESYARRHVRLVVDALAGSGHEVTAAEGDKDLLVVLEQVIPPFAESGRPSGLVFNMAYGIQGECRYTHVPAMLELAGVPYTGSCPLGHALALDKVVAKVQMQAAGVPTPAFKVLDRPDGDVTGLRYPLIVKPRHESTSYGLQLVEDRRQLGDAVAAILARYRQDALVEEYIEGREVCIGLLGNGEPECLPPVELDFGGRDLRLNTWDDKYHKRVDEPRKVCPAPLDPALAARLDRLAVATFHACQMRDYARVDIRIDPAGDPYVLEINSMASLGDGGSYVRAAAEAGYAFDALVACIVDVAHARCFGGPAPRRALATALA